MFELKNVKVTTIHMHKKAKVIESFKSSGLPCLVIDGPIGSACGYVGVPKGHPLFEVYRCSIGFPIQVHASVNGGITYSERISQNYLSIKVIGVDKFWYFGFDFSHAYNKGNVHDDCVALAKVLSKIKRRIHAIDEKATRRRN